MTKTTDGQALPPMMTAFVLLLILVLAGCSQRANETGSLSLDFKAAVGSNALVFNRIQYDNPGGEGQFKVRDFQFFISNIKLVSEAGIYLEPESYHIARFDNADKTHKIMIDNVPIRDYTKIEFSIGVDQAANSSVISTGDLDPNSRMAWSWDVGYKFILFEGGLSLRDVLRPLVYHIGFNENYKALEFPLNEAGSGQKLSQLLFKVDIMSLFTGVSIIDMKTLPSIKFDKADAKLIADNYGAMITLCSSRAC